MYPPNYFHFIDCFSIKKKKLKDIFFLKNKVSKKVIITNLSRIPATLKSL